MTTPVIQSSFAAGEIAPALYGHVDLAKYHTAATTMRNLFVNYRGGSNSRAGTAYVIQSATPVFVGVPRLITFRFSLNQGYLLEFGLDPNYSPDFNYIAFYFRGSPIVEAARPISGATQANPTVLTVNTTGWQNGDRISVAGINGMTPLNNRFFTVTVIDATHASIAMLNGTPVDSTLFPPYISGGTAARLYRISSPWLIQDLPLLKFAQSADVMSFTHPSYPPYDLTRIIDTDWTLVATDFSETLAAPGEPAAVASNNPNPSSSPPTQPAAYAYVVTAVDASGHESVASPAGNVTNSVDMAVTAGSITVTWQAVPGAAYYNIYRAPTSYNTQKGNTSTALPVPLGAIFSFVGLSYGTQFVDSNTTPDTSQVPPVHQNPFAPGQILSATPSATGGGYTTASVSITTATGFGAVIIPIIVSGQITGYIVQPGGQNYAPGDSAVVSGDGAGATAAIVIGPQTGTYPGVVSYFQVRRAYADSYNAPDTLWFSKPAQFTNFDNGIPAQDDDAITASPFGQQVDGIQWLLPVPGGLIAFTGSGGWIINGPGGNAYQPAPITPSGIQALPVTFAGVSATIQPIPVYIDILFVQSKGNVVRDVVYNYFTNNYIGSDQTVLSSHLFLGYELNQWAWAEEPYKIVWAVRCDGVLLSFTYLKEQEVYGWARHDTQGGFLAVATVSEPPVDAPYFVVERITPAGLFYNIERMDDRIWLDTEGPWAVDAGLSNPMPEFNVPLITNSLSGGFGIEATSNVFTPAMVGSVLRISLGIALLTEYDSPTGMKGFWLLPPSATAEGAF